ncbi:Phosphoribosylformylglycinamidine cyclo-ligase [Galdieria sulphuraria]|nr:Phosphoribosylformylglycinamidine cyclo-ligase [Galdieria sulphuraria]
MGFQYASFTPQHKQNQIILQKHNNILFKKWGNKKQQKSIYTVKRRPVQVSSSTEPPSSSWTYARSGVDIDLESSSVGALISRFKSATNGKDPRQDRKYGRLTSKSGQFAGLIEFGDKLLALTTDGVGNCVAMNVNDLLCVGAEPIAFVDYIAVPKANPETWASLGNSLAVACMKGRVSLCGGETATLPDLVKELDMSGTALGWVPKDLQITGDDCAPGDWILGFPSTGFHSNGYSLVRSIIRDKNVTLGEHIDMNVANDEFSHIERFETTKDEKPTVGEVLLNPTQIYVDPIVELFESCQRTQNPCNFSSIHGAVHITGGGLTNFLRLQPGKIGFEIIDPLPVLPEFRWLQQLGTVSNHEMYRTFNMGMGFALIVEPQAASRIQEWLQQHKCVCKTVGLVTSSGKMIHRDANVSYERY